MEAAAGTLIDKAEVRGSVSSRNLNQEAQRTLEYLTVDDKISHLHSVSVLRGKGLTSRSEASDESSRALSSIDIPECVDDVVCTFWRCFGELDARLDDIYKRQWCGSDRAE